MNTRVWSGAAVASVLLHGVGLGAIALSTEPEALPQQPVPKSRFSIEAAKVPRSRAAPETPLGDAAAQAEPPSTAAQSGSVVQSASKALQPAGQQIGATAARRAPLQASATSGTPTKAAAALSDNRVAPSTTQTDAIPANALSTQRVTIATQQSPTLKASPSPAAEKAATLSPVSSTLNAAQPLGPNAVLALATSATRPVAVIPAPPATAPNDLSSEPIALNAALGERAPPAAPDSQDTDALPLPALLGKAALAWSGEEGTPVSATSLAAITAFTQAGDLAAASAEVRDGIAGILASVPCARLQTTFLPDTGQLELRGHIPQDGLRGPVLAALQEQVGEAIALSDQLLILPRPQCGALAGIADVGLPQSTEQLSDPAVIGKDGFARTYTYIDGERLRLDLTAPDYDAYIYMDYFVADGSVIHLQPNDIVPLTFAPAKSAQSVGRALEGQPYLELIVSAPFGQEIAVAFASNVRLYEGTRPLQEPAAAYLTFLKERVAAARAKHADFKGEWVYFFISTQAG